MKLFPSSTDQKCGLLNFLNKKNNSLSPTLYVPENCHSQNSNPTYTLVNCEIDSDWASSTSDPSFSIQLYNYRILPYYVSFTRRNRANYPKQSKLQGRDVDKWVDICEINLAYTKVSETKVQSCKSQRYFSSFRVLQSHSSLSTLEYIEIDNFDIFGDILYDFSTLTKQCSMIELSLFALCFTIIKI